MRFRIAALVPRLIVATVVLTAAAFYRPQTYGNFADQMTYYLQADSIAFDGDLQFDQRDLARFRSHGWPDSAPYGLFLREAGGRFYYSKPFLYSLAAVPLVWLAPVRGPIFLNALLFLALMELTFRWYRRVSGAGRAGTVAVLAWVASAAPFSLFVIHLDLMVPALLAMALYLWLTADAGQVGNLPPSAPSTSPGQKEDRPAARLSCAFRLLLSGVFFGLATYEKNPLIFFAGAAAGFLLVRREWRHASLLSLAAAAAFLLPTSVHLAQSGPITAGQENRRVGDYLKYVREHFSPYQGNRVYCGAEFPFDDLDRARAELSAHRSPGGEFFDARVGRRLFSPERLARVAVELPPKALSFFVGRKTGLFPYLTPALIALALWLALRQWRQGGAASLWIAAALALYFLFYFLVLRAYYGGSTTIGNRYALQVFPAFLFLPSRLPRGRAGFGALIALMAGAGLFFPGCDLLTPYGKVRDNYALFLKPRFHWLPFEWHLAIYVPDQAYALIQWNETCKLLRLTDRNPTHDERGYFVGAAHHELALMSFVPADAFPVRLAAREQPVEGWVGSGRRRARFRLEPYETRVVRIPLTLRDQAEYPAFQLFCYPLEIATESPLEANRLYPPDWYRGLGPFVRWETATSPTLPTATVTPDDPRDASRLLWGWTAPESADAQGLCRRWAGEATESAVVLPAADRRDRMLRIVADCPVAMETEVRWNGRPLDKRFIGPGETTLELKIDAAAVRPGDNILSLRHGWLFQPSALLDPGQGSDGRWLAVHYQRIELAPAEAAPPTAR